MSLTPNLLMFLMFPWFFGHLACIFADGEYIDTTERALVNFVGSFTAPEQSGIWSTMALAKEAITETLARIVLWDYSFFDGGMELFRWMLLFVFTVPFLIGLALAIMNPQLLLGRR